MTYKEFKDAVRVKTREKMNIYLGKYRNRKLSNKNVTIISNNCWYFFIKFIIPQKRLLSYPFKGGCSLFYCAFFYSPFIYQL